jgi:hypothetical protein
MRKFEPDLAKNLNKEVRAALTPVQKTARGLVPETLPGLSNWGFHSSKITKESSAFAQTGHFPKYNASIVKKGIKIYLGKSKPNRNGFITFYRISNTTAAGAILETAGRKHPSGQPWVGKKGNLGVGAKGKVQLNHHYSHSNNPEAGLHFINSMSAMQGEGKNRGRIIYKAWAMYQGRALSDVMKAIDKTVAQFENRSYAQVFRTLK